MAVAIKVAPPSNFISRVVSIAGRGDEKSALIDFWAKKSGHSMNKHYQCVKCKLKIDCSRNLAYIEAVLELACITSNRSISYRLVNYLKSRKNFICFTNCAFIIRILRQPILGYTSTFAVGVGATASLQVNLSAWLVNA